MAASECGDVVLEEVDRENEKDDSFKSYHHQARLLLSHLAFLAGFFLYG